MSNKVYRVVAAIAILHNGKRYEQGDQIELTPKQADKLALYVELDKKAEKANKTKEKTDKQADAQQAEQIAEAPQE